MIYSGILELEPVLQLKNVIGTISGTSMDGIDVAMIKTDGLERVHPVIGQLYPYTDSLRAKLQTVIEDLQLAEHGDLVELESEVSAAHADAVLAFCHDYTIKKSDILLAGMHGQTVFHRPERNFTRQLGSGAFMARRMGINVVNRFRHADIAAGGHGAPLVPLYHRALASGLGSPLMILNLGGVANVTYIDGEIVLAFDTGPASALLDDFMRRRTGRPFDENGELAASGKVNQAMLTGFLDNPFFEAPPPKSLDRQDFNARARVVEGLSDADGAATLAAFTTHSVVAALRHVPKKPKRWLVAGGGRLNLTFMRSLRQNLGVPVEPVEKVGWNGDFLEAQCFAYLAMRSRLGLPLSLPGTTGVPYPLTGGEFWPAS